MRRCRLMLLVVLTFAVPIDAWSQSSTPKQKSSTMQNTYAATIKVGTSGLEKVTIKASNGSHAKQMLESQYGHGNVMNVHQTTSR